MSETKTIYHKIATIQTAIGAIPKTQQNDHFRSRYFDVNDLAEKLIPLLAEQNVLMTMPLALGTDGRQRIHLILRDLDTDDEITASAAHLPEGGTIQQLGSAITYLRRYLPVSYFYLQAEDDDGNAASGNGTGRQATQRRATPPVRSEAQHQGDDTPVIILDDDPLDALTK